MRRILQEQSKTGFALRTAWPTLDCYAGAAEAHPGSERAQPLPALDQEGPAALAQARHPPGRGQLGFMWSVWPCIEHTNVGCSSVNVPCVCPAIHAASKYRPTNTFAGFVKQMQPTSLSGVLLCVPAVGHRCCRLAVDSNRPILLRRRVQSSCVVQARVWRPEACCAFICLPACLSYMCHGLGHIDSVHCTP